MYRPVSLQEVWFEENLKEAPSQALNGIIYRENMDLFSIFDIRAGMNTVKMHRHRHINQQVPMDYF